MATTKIVFLILPEIQLLDLAGADQVFYEAKCYGSDIEIDYCSFENTIKTSTLLPIGKVKDLHEVSFKAGDYLIIPGAETSYILSDEFKAKYEIFDWLKMAYSQKVILCSVCTGAFVLALAGLLNNRKCTTHWKRTAQLQALFPKTEVVENILFMEDGGILTSAGVTSGIDLALHIVSQLEDDFFSYKVARELVIYIRRHGNQSQQSIFLQYRNHIHSGVHRVQDWLKENIHRKSSLPDLADIACMSTRNFTRVFKKETGISVNDFTTLIRKEKIKALIKKPDITRSQIANQCGLKSERQIIRLLKEL
ncbi:GlxA family transcriptional regulator [Emticicia sp. BO119]|uniref:GlxA family transcriptional regulator n=1 Tax=Emticicia sp. BO119 TaxID=2757768 RepID=UPI0015F0F483|nr:DJ-1/PfpI family protein [Emticicia sp. BO119]MBA4848938.1 DJ-1/PfpI family protein [Emticicia sp. BO119]